MLKCWQELGISFGLVPINTVFSCKVKETCHDFGQNDQFLDMNQLIAKSYWHVLILVWQKLIANQAC
jgi:hypothetical protein